MSTPPLPDRPRLPWDPPDHFERRIPDGDNRERLVCARCEFIHYQNPKIVAGAVCTWNDQILLAKRAIEPRKGFWTLPAGYMELGETTEQAALREAMEEACATIEIDRLLAMYSVARIGQVQIMYRARLMSDDVAPGIESEDVALVDWRDIPWDQLAFPTVVWALAHFHESRAKKDFATYSNPTGDLARSGRHANLAAFRTRRIERFLLKSYKRSVHGRIGGNHAHFSRKRHADARWAGHAHGQSDARILDPRLPVLGAQGRRRADAAHAAGRAAHRLPRHQRQGRHHGASLPASLRLAVLWAQRGRRAALRLSRLEVRRRRQLPRHAQRAAGAGFQGAHQGQGLQGRRALRLRVDLHGPAQGSASTAQHRSADAARGRALHPRAPA